MKRSKVSVVTVVYNAVDDIKNTLDSVASQDYGDLEYLVFDGASDDGTYEYLLEHKGIIDVLVSERDDGIYDAMNKAARKATGEWIIFMNAGDTFVSPKVVSQVMEYEEECDFIFGDRYKTEVNGVKTYEEAGPISDTFKREVVFHQALFTKRNLLVEKPYSSSYSLAADFHYVVSAFVAGKRFKHVPIPICDFKAGGRSRQQSLKAMTEAYKVVLDHQVDMAAWRDSDFLKGLVLNNVEYCLNKELQHYRAVSGGVVDISAGNRRLSLRSSPSNKQLDAMLAKVARPLAHLVHVPPNKKVGESKPIIPRITVISVVLNDRKGLERTLESIAALDYQNIEVIVVDGESTDGTCEYAGTRNDVINILVSEKDDGIYDAMNKGIRLATGDFLIFMNAGDEFATPDAVSNIFNDKNNFEGFDVVYGDRYYVSEMGKEVFQQAKPVDTIHVRMPFGHQSVFVKAELIKAETFNVTYRSAADYCMFVNFYLKGRRFNYIPGPVSRFYAGGTSEGGLLPYLEVLKIQIDHFKNKEQIMQSHYLSAFRNNVSKLLEAMK